MRRCPVCRASNQGASVCRRCHSDLTDIIAIEVQADLTMVQAVKYLQKGNIHQAKRLCTYACMLNQTEFGEMFSGFLDYMNLQIEHQTSNIE